MRPGLTHWSKNGCAATDRANASRLAWHGGNLCANTACRDIADRARAVTDELAGSFTDPQLPQALLATVVSVFIAAAGALFIALTIVVALWPGIRWRRLSTRLPWLLAIPHVAFASAALLLFAEGGLLWHALPFLSPAIDRYGIGLGVTLAVKRALSCCGFYPFY